MTHWHAYHLENGLRRNALVDFWYTGRNGAIATATLKASLELAKIIRANADAYTTVDDDHIFAYSNARGLWNWGVDRVHLYLSLVLGTAYNLTGLIHDLALSGHADRGAVFVRKIKNAFPRILGQPGIGSGWAFIMRYPFRPDAKGLLRRYDSVFFARAA